MTETPKSNDAAPPGKSVSMTKAGAAPASSATERPKQAQWAALALLVSAAGALVASLDLFGLKNWLFTSARKANNKLKLSDRKTDSQLHSAVHSTLTAQLVQSVILVAALVLIARAVYRGRYFSRMVVIGIWVLATFLNLVPGFLSLLGIGSSIPLGYKAPAVVSAIALIAAVVLTSMRPNVQYFSANRPARPEGAPQRRGLFGGPRPAAGSRATAGSRPAGRGFGAPGRTARGGATVPATVQADVTRDPARSRSKQRASAESVARGAELARARAKASKSRRSGT